jgi:hypothetical protein
MSDRKQLEEAEARVLYCTWKVTQDKVLTEDRKAWINRTYGAGAVNRIQAMMLEMHKADLEIAGLSPSTEN